MRVDTGVMFVPVLPPPPFSRPLPNWARERLWRVACLHRVGLQALLPTPVGLRDQRVIAYAHKAHPVWHIPLAVFLSLPDGWLMRNFPKIQGREGEITIEVDGLQIIYPYALFQGAEIEGALCTEWQGQRAWYWRLWK